MVKAYLSHQLALKEKEFGMKGKESNGMMKIMMMNTIKTIRKITMFIEMRIEI
jgi:hypothetical protein